MRLEGKRPTDVLVSGLKKGLASNKKASVFAPADAAWNRREVGSPLRASMEALKET
jgi:hypothetical protein